MLTKDLLRFADGDGRITPKLLKTTPAIRTLAEELIAHWDGGAGFTLGELEETAIPILHRTRSLVVAKGLQKLVLDGCAFRDAASCAELREKALAISAKLMAGPAADPAAHRAAVEAEVGPLTDLYGDLPHAAILEKGCGLDPQGLIDRYNLAQCQGLLLTARELDITVHDADTGLRRKLLKALRFQRLLAEVRPVGTALRLIVSGPGTVLDQASRYGLNLALFLPALACAERWEATAWVAPGRERAGSKLELSDELGLIGDTRFLGFVPEEIRVLEGELRAKKPEWKHEDPQLLQTYSGELVVPDLQLRVEGTVRPVELFHRWHGAALERRLAQLAAGELPTLVIGVDRAIAKKLPGLESHPGFAWRGFVFSELPTVRALSAVLASPAGAPAPRRPARPGPPSGAA